MKTLLIRELSFFLTPLTWVLNLNNLLSRPVAWVTILLLALSLALTLVTL